MVFCASLEVNFYVVYLLMTTETLVFRYVKLRCQLKFIQFVILPRKSGTNMVTVDKFSLLEQMELHNLNCTYPRSILFQIRSRHTTFNTRLFFICYSIVISLFFHCILWSFQFSVILYLIKVPMKVIHL